MSTTIYGLIADGHQWLAGSYDKFSCRKMFTTRAAAEAEVSAFKERCSNSTDCDLDCMVADTIQVDIFEFELCD